MKKTVTTLAIWLSLFTVVHAVTFKVTVPRGTKKCYVTGEFNKWSATEALELNKISANQFELDMPGLTDAVLTGTKDGGFKYLSGPDWSFVEKDADRNDISNRRTTTENDIVLNWLDIYDPNPQSNPLGVFNVIVPGNTKKCYITGNFNNWNIENPFEMKLLGDNQYYLDLRGTPVFNNFEGELSFKYVNGPSWEYGEKDKAGNKRENRTIATTEDVVLQWGEIYNPSLSIDLINFNSTRREIHVLTPRDYKSNPEKRYPVLYLQGIRQRYSMAGADGNNGDDIFGDQSWGVQKTLEKLHNEGAEVGIVVLMYGFINEFSPWKNEDFISSGNGDAYIEALIKDVIPHINNKYRTLTGPENTAIAGSDMGGLISYYAALKHQDKFGKSGVFSPSFWFNKNDLTAYLNSWSKKESRKMFFSVGAKEGKSIRNDAREIFEQTKEKGYDAGNIIFETYSDGTHDDISWGRQFKNFYTFLSGTSYTPRSKEYQFMGHSDTKDVVCDGNAPFSWSTYYPNGTEKNAEELQAYIGTIPAEFKKTYNWNINTGNECNGTTLFTENRTIISNSNKSSDSWFRIYIHVDNTVTTAEASSQHFRVIKADDNNGIIMSASKADGTAGEDNSYSVSAEVNFTENNKNFEIHYGNINNGSDMGSLTGNKGTYPIQVPKNCIKALIIYNFRTNHVTIKPLQTTVLDNGYLFMAGNKADAITCDTGAQFEHADFYTIGSNQPEKTKVYVKEVPMTEKGDYFWNINIGNVCSDNRFSIDNKKVSFSSKKSTISWIRCAIFQNQTTEDIAVSSEHFRVITGTNEVIMSRSRADGLPGTDNTYTLSATVDFKTPDKAFEICYGSVNSGSKMNALTNINNVSENCLQARIIYCFKTNKVVVEETRWGKPTSEISDTKPVVSYFMATPSVCKAGATVRVSALIAETNGFQCSFKVSHNYGNTTPQSYTVNEKGEMTFTIKNILSGIYEISLDAVKGSEILNNFLTICIKVPFENNREKVEIKNVINAYDEINWATTGRYKGNFHAHTSQSNDTEITTTEAVDLYHDKGYQILALTDHDYNSYPWTMFDTFNPDAANRDPRLLDMLAIPAIELSKDHRNNWNDVNGNSFNHHNDFFTGRKGQEFAFIEQSFAYTQKLGGMQIVNHPGQYWSLDNTYDNNALQRNSPAWHASNFKQYESLIGLEVYNQGNRRPNDRILWDQILDRTMPDRPVFGYSCADSHSLDQYFHNYQFMLMDELSLPALKDAMKKGKLYFSYEYVNSGEAKAPGIQSITVDKENKTITIETPNHDVCWISGTDIKDTQTPGSRKSSVVGYGKTFCFDGFLGNYIRALIKNRYGETCTQPFGFTFGPVTDLEQAEKDKAENAGFTIYPNPAQAQTKIVSDCKIGEISLINMNGQILKSFGGNKQTTIELNLQDMDSGIYLIKVKTETFTKSKLLNIVK